MASETEVVIDARLERDRDRHAQRLASETEEEREGHLQRMQHRLASETEERVGLLQRMTLYQQQKLALETDEERSREAALNVTENVTHSKLQTHRQVQWLVVEVLLQCEQPRHMPCPQHTQ